MVAEIGGGGPFYEIRGGEDTDFEGPSIGNYHHPMVLEPCDLGVTELSRGRWDDRVLCIFLESVTTIERVCEILGLRLRGVESVKRDYTVRLVREKPRCVVCIDHCTSTENSFVSIFRVEGNFLIVPVVEIFGCRVAPMLVSGYSFCWVV